MNSLNTKSCPCAQNCTNAVSSPHSPLLGTSIWCILLSQLHRNVTWGFLCHGSSQGVGPDPKPGLFTALLNPPLTSELASGLVACGCPSHPAVRFAQPQPTPSLWWCHHGGPLCPFTSSSLRVTSVGTLPDWRADKMKGDLERCALWAPNPTPRPSGACPSPLYFLSLVDTVCMTRQCQAHPWGIHPCPRVCKLPLAFWLSWAAVFGTVQSWKQISDPLNFWGLHLLSIVFASPSVASRTLSTRIDTGVLDPWGILNSLKS